jgi:hypothetical protein
MNKAFTGKNLREELNQDELDFFDSWNKSEISLFDFIHKRFTKNQFLLKAKYVENGLTEYSVFAICSKIPFYAGCDPIQLYLECKKIYQDSNQTFKVVLTGTSRGLAGSLTLSTTAKNINEIREVSKFVDFNTILTPQAWQISIDTKKASKILEALSKAGIVSTQQAYDNLAKYFDNSSNMNTEIPHWEQSALNPPIWWQKRLCNGLITLKINFNNGDYIASVGNNWSHYQKRFPSLYDAQNWCESEAMRVLAIMKAELSPINYRLFWTCGAIAILLHIAWLRLYY